MRQVTNIAIMTRKPEKVYFRMNGLQVEQGVPKEKLAMLAIPMMPLQIILPWIISRYTAGPRPMDIFLKAMPPRLLMGLIFCLLVYYTPMFADADGQFPMSYYAMVLIIYAFHQVMN